MNINMEVSRSAKYQANTRLRARFLFVLTNLKTLKRRLGRCSNTLTTKKDRLNLPL